MRRIKTDFQMIEELQKQFADRVTHTDEGTDCRITPNVGMMMAAAMAAVGKCPLTLGGQTACETDYLAAQKLEFPSDVTIEEMEAFNRETMKPFMEEADEMRRYAAIAKFFRRTA